MAFFALASSHENDFDIKTRGGFLNDDASTIHDFILLNALRDLPPTRAAQASKSEALQLLRRVEDIDP